jgi:hypothetical protein
MAEYRVGDQTFRRKNLYLPCIISARTAGMTDAERVAVLKAAYWADNITNAEWPLVLRHDGVKAYVRSRFKKKAAGWLMALARIAAINPELFVEITAKAEEMYREQIEQPSFALETLRNVAENCREAREQGLETRSQVWTQAPEEEAA